MPRNAKTQTDAIVSRPGPEHIRLRYLHGPANTDADAVLYAPEPYVPRYLPSPEEKQEAAARRGFTTTDEHKETRTAAGNPVAVDDTVFAMPKTTRAARELLTGKGAESIIRLQCALLNGNPRVTSEDTLNALAYTVRNALERKAIRTARYGTTLMERRRLAKEQWRDVLQEVTLDLIGQDTADVTHGGNLATALARCAETKTVGQCLPPRTYTAAQLVALLAVRHFDHLLKVSVDAYQQGAAGRRHWRRITLGLDTAEVEDRPDGSVIVLQESKDPKEVLFEAADWLAATAGIPYKCAAKFVIARAQGTPLGVLAKSMGFRKSVAVLWSGILRQFVPEVRRPGGYHKVNHALFAAHLTGRHEAQGEKVGLASPVRRYKVA